MVLKHYVFISFRKLRFNTAACTSIQDSEILRANVATISRELRILHTGNWCKL
jgi:hypothetical protein